MMNIEKISKRWQRICFSNDRGEHYPVMHREVLEYLQPHKRGIIVDGTLGMGMHAELLLENMAEGGRLIGLDRDTESMALARERLERFGERAVCVHSDYRLMDEVLDRLGIDKVDGILLDLGISMYQLDSSERGFSFQKDGALDMRMDRSESVSAYDLVNNLSERELEEMFRVYGEERFSRQIASGIVTERREGPIATTMRLARVVGQSIPARARKPGIDPATRVFQALRIAVNHELASLEEALQKALYRLNPGGRFVVITFHSLEDRIVKRTFRTAAQQGPFHLVVKKVVTPASDEIEANVRSRSAKMRVIESAS
jgi:16S rRNA (cytosine1402-N4)-methyltransferase